MADVFAELFDVGNAAGFASRMISEGVGVTEGRALFRDAGGRIGNQVWSRIYGETKAAFGNRSNLADLSPDDIPGDHLFTDWTVNNPRGNATQVTVFVRDRGSDSVDRLGYTHFSDGPVSPQEAIDAAMDMYTSAAAEGGSFAGQVILGAAVTGLYRQRAAA